MYGRAISPNTSIQPKYAHAHAYGHAPDRRVVLYQLHTSISRSPWAIRWRTISAQSPHTSDLH
eukprot:6218110-Prymnesium_polylepis.2